MNPGTLNITSGTVTGDITIQASAATPKTQNGTLARWNELKYVTAGGNNYGRTGWDLNNGGISPKKPLSALCICFVRDTTSGGDSGLVYYGRYTGVNFAIDSEYQSKYDACSTIRIRMDNVRVRRKDSNDLTSGYIQFDIIKSEVEVLKSSTGIAGQIYPPDRYSTANLHVDDYQNPVIVAYNGWDTGGSDNIWNSIISVMNSTIYANWTSVQVTTTFI